MRRTAKEFRNAAIKHNIGAWRVRECSICGYPIGYLFFRDREVYFDGGCDCCYGDLRPSSWEDVAEFYSAQTNENVIAEFDKFWHFDEQQAAEAVREILT